MNGKPFTLEQVLKVTREVVEEKGLDFVYLPPASRNCVYADVNGDPSCLVGHVINRLDPEAFRNLAAVEVEQGGEMAASLMVNGDYLPRGFWEEDAAFAMNYAQVSQDEGNSWGDALYAAENMGADAE